MIDFAIDELKIIHIEDDYVTQSMVKTYLKAKLKAKVDSQSTILGALRHIKGDPVDSIDAYICDWMLPCYDAGHIVKELYYTGRLVIFYTCIDQHEIEENVKSILGFMPKRFYHVQKGAESNMQNILNLIESEL